MASGGLEPGLGIWELWVKKEIREGRVHREVTTVMLRCGADIEGET